MNVLCSVVDDGGASAAADSFFEPDAAFNGPREEQLATNMKIMQKQRMLCEFSTARSELAKISESLCKMKSSQSYRVMRASDQDDLQIDANVKQIKEEMDEIDKHLKAVECISARSPDSEAQFELFRALLHELNTKNNRWTMVANTVTQADGVFV